MICRSYWYFIDRALVDPKGQAVLPISEFEFASITKTSAIEESLSHLLERKDQTEISRCLPMAERNDSSTRTFESQDLLLNFSVQQIVAFVHVLTPEDPSGLNSRFFKIISLLH